jgi:hypothetical protein
VAAQLALNLGITMALCFTAWGLFYAGLYRKLGIDYTRRFLLTTGYFFTVAIIALVIFRQLLTPILTDISMPPLVTLTLFMIFQTILYVLLPRYIRKPEEYFNRYPDRYFLKIDWRRLISKSADIVAQQFIILVLVLSLHDAGIPLPQLCLLFGFLFMLLHIPLIASERGAWTSWLFATIVVVFSIIFPVLILTVSYGFIYNIVLHWLFYTVTAIVFWFWYDRNRKRAVMIS